MSISPNPAPLSGSALNPAPPPFRHSDSLAIYDKALEVATKELGISHAYTQLTRGNRAESLDIGGDRAAARAYLMGCLEALGAEEARAKGALDAAGMKDEPRPQAVAPPASIEEGSGLKEDEEGEGVDSATKMVGSWITLPVHTNPHCV